MSRFSQIPSDIALNSLLQYIKPSQLDLYCQLDDYLYQWCERSENIEFYLKLRNFSDFVPKSISILKQNWTLGRGESKSETNVDPNFSNFEDINFIYKGLHLAAKAGSIMLTNYFLFKGAKNYPNALITAAKRGHLHIVEIIMNQPYNKLTAVDYQVALDLATRRGHINVIEFILNRISLDDSFHCNNLMAHAAFGGHQNIISLMMSKGANDFNWGLERAITGGQLIIAKQMIDLGALIDKDMLMLAIKNKNIKIVDLILHKYITLESIHNSDLNEAFPSISKKRDIRDDLNEALQYAAKKGFIMAVDIILNFATVGIKSLMKEVKYDWFYGSLDIDYETAIYMAQSKGHIEIVNYLQEVEKHNLIKVD